jgi:hypothetical protein
MDLLALDPQDLAQVLQDLQQPLAVAAADFMGMLGNQAALVAVVLTADSLRQSAVVAELQVKEIMAVLV